MKTKKVLVVDDKEDVLEILIQFAEIALNKLGVEHDIVSAGSSDVATDLISEGVVPFDIILSDIQCNPRAENEKAGFQIAKLAKEANPECIVIGMTGLQVDEELIIEAITFGMDSVIQKPFRLESVMARLQMFLNK